MALHPLHCTLSFATSQSTPHYNCVYNSQFIIPQTHPEPTSIFASTKHMTSTSSTVQTSMAKYTYLAVRVLGEATGASELGLLPRSEPPQAQGGLLGVRADMAALAHARGEAVEVARGVLLLLRGEGEVADCAVPADLARCGVISRCCLHTVPALNINTLLLKCQGS